MTRSSIVTTTILVLLSLLAQPENTTTHATSYHTVADSLMESSLLDSPIIKTNSIDSFTTIDTVFNNKLVEAECINALLRKENKKILKQAIRIEELVECKISEDSLSVEGSPKDSSLLRYSNN